MSAAWCGIRGGARLILTLGWAPKESLEMAQKVRTHYIFAQRNEAVFCLTTRFIRAKWKMDLHYCSEYDKKQAILREDLFSLTCSMLGIIDLV